MIDRIGPTQQPTATPVGNQEWRSLLFLHWPLPAEILRPLVPQSLELDSYEGVAYVGLVPFYMSNVRPRWSPLFLAQSFLETNVRTYVTHRGQPGVYFFSLDAASRLAVWVARTFWGLPYHYADMSLEQDGDALRYRTVRHKGGHVSDVRCRIGESLPASDSGSIEFFFLERYLLFLERRQQVYVGQVHHTPYPVQRVAMIECNDNLVAAAGCTGCMGPPPYAHYSPGVDVEIFALKSVG